MNNIKKRVIFTSVVLLFFVTVTGILSATYNTKQTAAVLQSSSYYTQADIDKNIQVLKDAFADMDSFVKTINVNETKMAVTNGDGAANEISQILENNGVDGIDDVNLSKKEILKDDNATDTAIIKNLTSTSAKIDDCLKLKYFTNNPNDQAVKDTKDFLVEQKHNLDRLALIQPSISDGSLELLTRSDIEILRSYYGDITADVIEQQMNLKDFNVSTDENYDYASMPFSDDGTPMVSGVTWIDCGGYAGWVRLKWTTKTGQSGSIDKAGGSKCLAQTSDINFKDLGIPEGSKIQFGINVRAGPDSEWSDVFVVTYADDVSLGFQTSGTIFKSPKVHVLMSGTKDQVSEALHNKSKSLVKMIGLIIGALLLAIAGAIVSALTFGALAPAAAMSETALAALIGVVVGTIDLSISLAIQSATHDVDIENVDLDSINKSRYFYNQEKQKFGIYGFEYVSTGYYSSCPEVHFIDSNGAEHTKKANDGKWIRLGKASGDIGLKDFTASDGTKIQDGDEVWIVPKVLDGRDRETRERFIYDSKSTVIAGYAAQGNTQNGDMRNHLVGFGGPKTVEAYMSKYVHSAKWEFIAMMVDVAMLVVEIALDAICKAIEAISEAVQFIIDVVVASAFDIGDAIKDFDIENPAEGTKAYELAMQERQQTIGILNTEENAIRDILLPKAKIQLDTIAKQLEDAAEAKFPPANPNVPHYDFPKLFFSDDLNLPSSLDDTYRGKGTIDIDGKRYLSATQYAIILGISPNDELITTALELRPSYISTINLINDLLAREKTIEDEIYGIENSALSGYFTADMAFSNLLNITDDFKDKTLNSYVGQTVLNFTNAISKGNSFSPSLIAPTDNTMGDNIYISKLFDSTIKSFNEETFENFSNYITDLNNIQETIKFTNNLTTYENDLLYNYIVDLVSNKGKTTTNDPKAEELFSQYLMSVPESEKLIYTAGEGVSWLPNIAKFIKEKLKDSGKDVNKILFSSIFVNSITKIITQSIPVALKVVIQSSFYIESKNNALSVLSTLKQEAIDTTNVGYFLTKRANDEIVSAINIERKEMKENANNENFIATDLKAGLYKLIYDTNKLIKTETYYNDKQNLTLIRDFALFELKKVVTAGDDKSNPDESKIFPETTFQKLADIFNNVDEYEKKSISIKVLGVTPESIKTNTKNAYISVYIDASSKAPHAPDAQYLSSTMTGAFKFDKMQSLKSDLNRYFFTAPLKQLKKSGKNDILITYYTDPNFYQTDVKYTINTAKSDSSINVKLVKNAKVGKSTIIYQITVFANQITPSGKIQYSLNKKPSVEAIIPTIAGTGLEKASFDISITDVFSVGNQTLDVYYEGDDSVNPSSTEFDSTVEKEATSIVNVDYNNDVNESDDSFIVTGAVMSDVDLDITGTVTVNYADKFTTNVAITKTTFKETLPDGTVNSYATFSALVDLNSVDIKAGNYTFTISYSGDDDLKPSSITENQTIEKEDSTLEITSPENPTIDDDALVYSVTISSLRHNVTGKVLLSLDGPAAYKDTVKQNIVLKGKSKTEVVTFKADKEIFPGDYNFTAVYSGDDYINGTSGSSIVTVNYDDSTVAIDDIPVNIHTNIKGLTISGVVGAVSKYKPTGEINAVITPKVSLKSKESLKQNVINSDIKTFASIKANIEILSDSSFSIFVPMENVKGGDYTVTINYLGDVNFNPSVSTRDFNIIGTYVYFNYNLKKADDIYKVEVTYDTLASYPPKREDPLEKRLGGWYFNDKPDSIKPFDFDLKSIKDDITLTAIYTTKHPRFIAHVDKIDGTSDEITFYGSRFAPYEKLVLEMNSDADKLLSFTATENGNFTRTLNFDKTDNYGENTMIVKTDVNDYQTEEVEEYVNVLILDPDKKPTDDEDKDKASKDYNVDKVAGHTSRTTLDEKSKNFIVITPKKDKSVIKDVINAIDKNGLLILIIFLGLVLILIAIIIIRIYLKGRKYANEKE